MVVGTNLHDSFEVETHSVPERELSAAGACQQPPTLGCPLVQPVSMTTSKVDSIP